MSDRVVREVSENLFHLSPFREGDGAAMCRRPPRGWLDIVGAKLLWGVPDGGFLVPSFSQKSGIIRDIQKAMFARTGTAVELARGVCRRDVTILLRTMYVS